MDMILLAIKKIIPMGEYLRIGMAQSSQSFENNYNSQAIVITKVKT